MAWATQGRKGLLQLLVSQDPVHGAWLCVQGQDIVVVGVCADLVGPWKQLNRKARSTEEKMQPLTTHLPRPAPLFRSHVLLFITSQESRILSQSRSDTRHIDQISQDHSPKIPLSVKSPGHGSVEDILHSTTTNTFPTLYRILGFPWYFHS